MTLYFIGIGLADPKDITLKGLEAVNRSDFVYLESYTSILQCSKEELEKAYGKEIKKANRQLVEQNAEEILENAKEKDVAFLVIGDPFCATTHVDLRLRAKEKGVKIIVIHNASILNAIGEIGLELYKFGKVTSIPFENKNVKAPLDVYNANKKIGLHTLFLLDLDPEKGKFMTIKEAISFLIEKGLDKNERCIGCCAMSSDKQEIKAGKAEDLVKMEFKEKPQCLIIPGDLHFMEEEALDLWK